MGPIIEGSDALRTSTALYCTDEFKGGPQLFPHYAERRQLKKYSPQTVNVIFSVRNEPKVIKILNYLCNELRVLSSTFNNFIW